MSRATTTRKSSRPAHCLAGLGRRMLAGFFLAEVLAPGKTWACAACFGKSDSPLAAGMNWGIMSLLAFIVFVLGGVAGFFIFLARRSAAVNAAAELTPGEVEPAEAVETAFAPEFARPAARRRFCRQARGLAPWKRRHRPAARMADTRSFSRG